MSATFSRNVGGKMSRIFLSACAGVFCVFCTVAHSTNVSGIIGTNTTWNAAGNPYTVTGNVLVDTLVTLTIQPGAEVRLDSADYIMIKGTLNAIGTAADSITITRNGTARWARLWFKSAAPCSLKYCTIEYAGSSAVYNEGTGLLYIGYCTIDSCSSTNDDGGGIYNSGSALIAYNTITNNSAGYYSGGGISNENGSATIINNTISNNSSSGGGGIFTTGSCTIANNTIANNMAYAGNGGGIEGGNGTIITGNTISNNFAVYGGAIWGGGTIRYNTITDTTPYAIRIRSAFIRTNNIYASHYSAYNEANPAVNVDARYNYWGTTDTAIITTKIHDFYDDFTIGKVIYKPFLNQAFSDTVAPASPLNLISRTMNDSTFVITWTNPSDPSGISEYYYKTGSAPVSDFDTTGRFHAAPDTVIAAAGMLYVWLVDSSGNLNYHNNGSVMLSHAGIRESKSYADIHLSFSVMSGRSLTGRVLQYDLPEKTHVSLLLFDISGRLVKAMFSGTRERGFYTQTLQENDFPSAGMYYVRFRAGEFTSVKRLAVLR
jgi:hypothetical protein